MNAFHHLRNSFCILFPFPLSARNNLFYLDTPAYKIIFQTKTENSAVIHYPLLFIPPINCHDWTNSGGDEGSRTPVQKPIRCSSTIMPDDGPSHCYPKEFPLKPIGISLKVSHY